MNFLFVFVGGFMGGVAFRSFFKAASGDFSFPLVLFLVGGVLLALSFVHMYKKTALVRIAGVLVLASALGIFRFDISELTHGSPALDESVGSAVMARGVVIGEPDVRENHTKLIVRIDGLGCTLSDGACTHKTGGSRVLVVTELYPEFSYGDLLFVRGVLKKPENFEKENDPGRSFDYISFLAKDGIYYQMFYPNIVLEGYGAGNPVRQVLFTFKQKFLDNISAVLPEPHASLLGGIIIGAKRAMGESLLQDFRVVGLAHIVVLSGYNITVVAEAVGRVSAFLPGAIRYVVPGVFIAAFALMAGAGATVLRASLMASLVLVAKATGRIYEITVALFVSAFAMVLWNPKILLFDPSFQLSFLASVGLIHVTPRIYRFFRIIPERFALRELSAATVATQGFVAPLLLYMSGMFSSVALPVNLLVLPFVPLVMFLGFGVGLFGFAHEYFSLPFAFVLYFFLEYILRAVEFFASIPFSSLYLSSFPAWCMAAVYVLYVFLLVRSAKKETSVSRASSAPPPRSS